MIHCHPGPLFSSARQSAYLRQGNSCAGVPGGHPPLLQCGDEEADTSEGGGIPFFYCIGNYAQGRNVDNFFVV